jgi:hypothetical protein
MTISRDDLIEQANNIIGQYEGLKLTVRQIYYRLVASQLIPNSTSSYQKVVKALVYARKQGSVDYDDIEDRTREVHRVESEEYESATSYFNGYLNYIKRLDENYTLPLWWNQPVKMQVWVEKQALSSLFQAITDKWGVDLVVCRGYPSLTLLHEASVVLNGEDDKDLQIIYFGDFDPSGADIERNVGESLDTDFGVVMDIERIAITRDQIDKYHIPPAPAKTSDSRYEGFLEREGVAWQVELDAIEPKTLQKMIEGAIKKHYDGKIALSRAEELLNRRSQIREWIEGAINQDFEPPEDED